MLSLILPGMNIVVQNKATGTYVDAVVLEEVAFSDEVYWWVEIRVGTTKDVVVYLEKDLIDWNYGHLVLNVKKCTCGAASVGSPGHAVRCDLYVQNPYY